MESGPRSAWRLAPALIIPAAAAAAIVMLPVPSAFRAGGVALAVALGALWITRRVVAGQREELAKIAASVGAPEASVGAILGRLDAGAQERRQELSGAAQHAAALRGVLDAADAPILATDAGGAVTLCNSAGADLLGSRLDRLAGRPLQDVLPQAEVLRLHAAALAGRASQGEVRLAGAGGVRSLGASAAPLAGGGAVIVFRDVTELSRAVQVKSDFVANASHELRTPITALRMAVETLAGGADQDAAMRGRLLETIAGNTARLEEMVRDLLDLSRLEAPEAAVHLEPVSPSEVEAALAAAFAPVCAERGLTLVFDAAPSLAALHTDRRLLLLILRNLVENATKFAYEGSTVRVTARPTTDGVRLEVIDRGMGIPLQHQQRVFERYYQVDAARTLSARRRGTGLGLAIVKHAVKRLGGGVQLASVWKEGTTVTVDLPGPPAGAAHGPSPAPQAPP